MNFEEIFSEEDIEELIDDFMNDIKESFHKSYADFEIESQQDLEDISFELKNILEEFSFFADKSKRETVECQQLIITLNLMAIKTKSDIYVLPDKKENHIACLIKSKLLIIKDELLPLLTYVTKHCEKIYFFNDGIHFVYGFAENQ